MIDENKYIMKVLVKECEFHRSCKIKYADEIICDDCEVVKWYTDDEILRRKQSGL